MNHLEKFPGLSSLLQSKPRAVSAGRALALAGAALALLLASGAASAQEPDEEKVRVLVKRSHGDGAHHEIVCQGDDCDHAGANVMFIDEDGNHSVLGGEHGLSWVSAEEGDGNVFVMKKGGDFAFGKRAVLGVQLTELTDQLRATFGVPEGEGTMISKVVEGSAAERAGLRAGDVITSVNGEVIRSPRQLASAIQGLDDGANAALEVWRDSSVQKLDAQVQVRESGMHTSGESMMRVEKRKQCTTEEDCQVFVEVHNGGDGVMNFDPSGLCGGSAECRVEVRCEDAEQCSCTVNGEAHDCSGLPGLPQ